MSEFWVSKKRYWCKYCETYIADDAPSRSQHENGLRHKGNKERFVNKLYKHAEQKKKDAAEEQREMARVDQAARAAFASDVSSGHAKASSSSLPPPRKAAASVAADKPKPSSPWANYSTAQSLGYVDPDEERRAAEAERQRTQGEVGAWHVVEAATTPVAGDSAPDTADGVAKSLKREATAVAVDEEDMRAFKVRKKTWGGLGDEWDPADVPIKLKVRRTEEAAPTSEASSITADASTSTSDEASGTIRPKWTTRGWNTPGTDSVPEDAREADASSTIPVDSPTVQPEDGVSSVIKAEESTTEDQSTSADTISTPLGIKTEDADVKVEGSESLSAPATSGMFRKRKTPAGSAGSRTKR